MRKIKKKSKNTPLPMQNGVCIMQIYFSREVQKMFNAEVIVFLGYFVILFFVGLIFFFNGSNKNQSD